jgi:hypothetical protein
MQRRLALALALACAVPAMAWADFRADFANLQGSGGPDLARIELSSLTTANVDAGDFAIPAGYAEQEIGGPDHRH